MSTIDPAMESMLEAFIAEGTSLLEELDEIMLESEKSKSMSEKNINEIFRIMHTIKGSSAMMGLEELSNFAHVMEDVFFIVRQTPSKLNLVMDTIFDLLFQASDYIKAELDIIQGGDSEQMSPDGLIEQLKAQAAIMEGQEPPAPAAASAAPAPAAAASNELPAMEAGMHQVRVYFDDGCQMVHLRAFMLLTQLQECCDKVISIPASPESDPEAGDLIQREGLIVQIHPTDSLEEALDTIGNAVNVKSYEVMDTAPAAEAAPAKESAAKAAEGTTPAAPAAEGKAAAATAAQGNLPKVNKQNLINVNQSKLDHLMDLVGEIVTAESIVSGNPDLQGLELDNFYKSTRELRKLTDELQDVVMSMRMVPLTGTFQKMNRIVRDMSKKLNKQVELETIGGDTEVDKTINDALGDPLMHMIRNSVDHAIESPEERRALGKPETGKIVLSAQNVGGEIVITISDDGCGLNTTVLMEKAKSRGLLVKPESDYSEKEIFGFIMLPGFSTNTEVTEFSGRGVGMDVVRKNIEKAGGTLSIDSKLNVGTTFTIKIPLTLAIVDGMEISVGQTTFTMPITSIKQTFRIADASQIVLNTDGSEMIMLRGCCYPVFRLHKLMNIETKVTDLMEGIVIHIEYGDREGCIFADELIGEQQVVVKPFPSFFNKYNLKNNGLSGCTVLGDGSISLILDANSLLHYFER